MSDPTIDRTVEPYFRQFERTPEVESIIHKRFAIREVAEILGRPYGRIQVFTAKSQIKLVSFDPPIGFAREYCVMDLWMMSIFSGFEKQTKETNRKTLGKGLMNAAFGDPMTEAEYQARRAAFARAESPGEFICRLHHQRRKELLQDPFSAQELWWSRSPTKQFFMLLKSDGNILTGLADKDIPGSGHIPIETLQKLGIRATLNCTTWLARVDAKIAEIVRLREAN